MANNVHVHAYRYVVFYLLSVFPSHLRVLNGQAKVRYCHNAVGGVGGSTYRPYLCTDYGPRVILLLLLHTKIGVDKQN